MTQRSCVICGVTFTPTGNYAKFCGDGCRRVNERARIAAYREANREKIQAESEARRTGPYRAQHTCTVCGATFTSTAPRGCYCSVECRKAATAAKTRRAYVADPETARNRVKAYRQANPDKGRESHRAWRRGHEPCAACGADTGKKAMSDRRVVCSEMCRYFLRFGRWSFSEWPRIYRVRVWAQGRCHRCEKVFLAKHYEGCNFPRWCSKRCGWAIKAANREALKRGTRDGYVEVVPNLIYRRDAWRCHICRRKVQSDKTVPHPMAPTIDHLVPLAHGGQHAPVNVATAHFICNSRKGSSGFGDQLALLG